MVHQAAWPTGRVGAMVVIVIMVLIVVVMSISRPQERRLEIENPIEIESVTAEYGVECHAAALRLVQRCIRIERTQPLLQPAQGSGRDQVGLVEQDHIGEGDL